MPKAPCRPKTSPSRTARATIIALGVLVCLPITVSAQVVEKLAEPFDVQAWTPASWNKAEGTAKLVAEVPSQLKDHSQRSLRHEVEFTGKGHQYYSAGPSSPIVIPGNAKRITVWARSQSEGGGYGWTMKFIDGWGRSKVDGKDLEWELSKSGLDESWKQLTFEVPDEWVRPISIISIGTHNWSSRQTPGRARLWTDDLRAATDISQIDPDTGKLRTWKPGPPIKDDKPAEQPVTPLLTATLGTPDAHNVFPGEQPALLISAQSWKPGELNGKLEWSVRDADNQPVSSGNLDLRIVDATQTRVPLPLEKYGLYRVAAELAWSDGSKTTAAMPLAYIPKATELTDAEKEASPYGLNVHGGRDRMVQTFRDAGVVWFRDFAFDFKWMVRAKGADKSYGGWPYYPQMVKEYDDAGAMLVACHANAIKRPPADAASRPETIGPDLEWTRELVDLTMAFPQIRYHEVDNEYDLPFKGNAKFEEPIDWANYNAFHKKFGEVLKVIGDGHFVAVENGRSGVWPDRVRSGLASNSLTQMQVINSHHYTGVEAPELNVDNNNTGFSDRAIPRLFFDQLRDAKKAATADGVQRQHWLTEFGWDTEAGKVVSPEQQAAYLQRAYMMLLASGTEKGFWFFDKDLAENPTTFFGGCGLMDFDLKPKLSLVAFAGITQVLSAPEFVGIINAGDGTWGYVFRNRGEFIASLFTLEDEVGPRLSFPDAKLFDAFANRMGGSSVELGMMPVYAAGITPESKWYRQTAYMLESPYLEATVSGDHVTVQLRVHNNREQALAGKARLELPDGWSAELPEQSFEVKPGQTTVLPLSFRVSPSAKPGEQRVHINITEDAPVKQIPLRVRIDTPLAMTVSALPAKTGDAEVKVNLTNRSRSQAMEGTLAVRLPGAWSTSTPSIDIAELKPGESREVAVPISWTGEWQPDEAAAVAFTSADETTLTKPIIPGQMPAYQAKDITVDGKLSDWTDKYRVPAWLLGVRDGHSADADVYLAWAPDGLYMALNVRDSQVRVDSPQQFWRQIDALEVWLDAANTKKDGSFEKGHHQFFFVPQPHQERVYVGQWKRGDELDDTKQDIPGLSTAARKTSDGYVMEFKIPASLIMKYSPKPGGTIGLNLNLNATGELGDREVFWPHSKQEAGSSVPANWGTIRLMP